MVAEVGVLGAVVVAGLWMTSQKEVFEAGTIKVVARNGHTAQDMTIVLKPGLKLDANKVQRLVDAAVEPPRADGPSFSYDA